MKTFLIILLMIPTMIFADPRMEVKQNGGGFIHFPASFTEADDETFSAAGDPEIDVIGGVARGEARWTVVKTGSVYPLDQKTRFDSDNTDFTCVMVETNGTEYRSNSWYAVVTTKNITANTYEHYYVLRCISGFEAQ